MNKRNRLDQTNSEINAVSSIDRAARVLFRLQLASLAALAVFCTGCAMCCGPYDYHYPTHGGISQRSDPVWGRLGSLFSDPGPFGGPSADYNLTPRDGNKPTKSSVEDLDDGLDDLDPIDEEPDSNRTENRLPDNSEVLPPPRNDQRPSPDDETSIRRLRNQSRQGINRWR